MAMLGETAGIAEMKALIAQLPIAVYVCEAPSGLLRLYNRRAAELWGREPTLGEQRYCGALRLFRPDGTHLPHAETPMAEVLLFGGERNDDVVIERPDGSRITVRVNITALRDSQGHIVGAVNAFQDVTERTKAEDDAAHLAAVIVSADDAIISKLLDGRITSWNRAAERMFGYTEGEVLGKSITIIIPPDRLHEEEVIIQRLTRGESIEHFETERVAKDGRILQLSLSVSPIRDRRGRIVGASKVARDISEKRRFEREREELLARERVARADAETANQAKDDFFATLSHELRTPLSSILGWARLLRSGKLDRVAADRGLEVIERNSHSLEHLITDMFDVSRIISGKTSLDLEPVDLGSVIETAIDSLRPDASAKGITIQLALDATARFLVGDPGRLQQVVRNLVSNAVKFTPTGGSVEIRLTNLQEGMRLTVTDTGQGIAPDFLPHIFERFRQADITTTRSQEGLGLGLAIVRRIVELHDGTVRAESAGIGRGATFIVDLPQAGAAAAASPASPAQLTSLPPDLLEGVRVLVVDDSADTRQLLALTLELQKAHVVSASSAREALTLFQKTPPDVLVCDIAMPGTDGNQFIRQIRVGAGRASSYVPAVAVTAFARPEDRERALRAGFDAYLAKPIGPAELVGTIARLAGRGTRA
jgi:PAS domain S-box-containing protein